MPCGAQAVTLGATTRHQTVAGATMRLFISSELSPGVHATPAMSDDNLLQFSAQRPVQGGERDQRARQIHGRIQAVSNLGFKSRLRHEM